MADPGNDRLDPDRLLQTLEQAQSDARRGGCASTSAPAPA
ncbi:two component sensor domain protein [Bordetella holmesii 70147]|nr:two component sensor domain protein [Bordetella holmesii 70147]